MSKENANDANNATTRAKTSFARDNILPSILGFFLAVVFLLLTFTFFLPLPLTLFPTLFPPSPFHPSPASRSLAMTCAPCTSICALHGAQACRRRGCARIGSPEWDAVPPGNESVWREAYGWRKDSERPLSWQAKHRTWGDLVRCWTKDEDGANDKERQQAEKIQDENDELSGH